MVETILEEARSECYETIVMRSTDKSGIMRLFGGGITDHLLGTAQGLALWIVE